MTCAHHSKSWGEVVTPTRDILTWCFALHVRVVDSRYRFHILCEVCTAASSEYIPVEALQYLSDPVRVIEVRCKGVVVFFSCYMIHLTRNGNVST